jgi:hypothetical protein
VHDPAVVTVVQAPDQVTPLHLVHQFACGVVFDLQAIGDLPDGRAPTLRNALHCHHELILHGLQSSIPRSSTAMLQEPVEPMAKLGQDPVLD